MGLKWSNVFKTPALKATYLYNSTDNILENIKIIGTEKQINGDGVKDSL